MPLWRKRKEVLVENVQSNNFDPPTPPSRSPTRNSPQQHTQTSPKKNSNKSQKESAQPSDDQHYTAANSATGGPAMSGKPENGANAQQQDSTDPKRPPAYRTPKYQFHCQLAQGSPTGIISGFTNVKELYAAIAECFEFEPEQILFCTLDTHKPEMNKLLGGQIALDNLIFAHTKGQAKEIDITKHEDALGLTITDNGAGYAFIKRIKADSIMARIELVCVGDHIEKINGKSVVGSRHYEVAKMLKDIPRGGTFTIRLVEPMKSPLSMVSAYRGNKKKNASSLGTGKATIRLKASGGGEEGVIDDNVELAVRAIDGLLESFMGVNDADLARGIYERAEGKANPSEFAVEIDEAFFEFEFTDDFIYDVWGVIGDAKAGRLKSPEGAGRVDFNEQF